MKSLNDFLEAIKTEQQRDKVEELLNWIAHTYPSLGNVIKWNQPMFTDHNTYIIGFSISKQHIAVAPETITIHHFEDEIAQAGYTHTDNIIKIKWQDEINYTLLSKIIEFNIKDKEHTKTFWR